MTVLYVTNKLYDPGQCDCPVHDVSVMIQAFCDQLACGLGPGFCDHLSGGVSVMIQVFVTTLQVSVCAQQSHHQ